MLACRRMLAHSVVVFRHVRYCHVFDLLFSLNSHCHRKAASYPLKCGNQRPKLSPELTMSLWEIAGDLGLLLWKAQLPLSWLSHLLQHIPSQLPQLMPLPKEAGMTPLPPVTHKVRPSLTKYPLIPLLPGLPSLKEYPYFIISDHSSDTAGSFLALTFY
jgi:hypothetical protein